MLHYVHAGTLVSAFSIPILVLSFPEGPEVCILVSDNLKGKMLLHMGYSVDLHYGS